MILALLPLLIQSPCDDKIVPSAFPAADTDFGSLVAADRGRLVAANQRRFSASVYAPWETLDFFDADPVTGDWALTNGIPISPTGLDRVVDVELSGDTGLIHDVSGDVYLVDRDPMTNTWSLGALLTTTAGPTDAEGGSNIALVEEFALVGDPGINQGRGEVRVYERSAGTWALSETLAIPSAPSDNFGASVAYDGRFIVVGIPNDANGRGDIRFYRRRFTTPGFEDLGGGGGVSPILRGTGTTVAVLGDSAIVAAPRNITNFVTPDDVGVVFVYRYAPQEDRWIRVQTLFDLSLGGGARFGETLAAGDGFFAASASDPSGATSGRAVIYRFNPQSNLFDRERVIDGGVAPAPFDGARFGTDISISAGRLFVGMPQEAGDLTPGQIGVTPVSGVDCDGDSLGDSCELILGTERDLNRDGTPDACAEEGIRYCSPAVANSTGAPARIGFFGRPSTALISVNLYCEGLPPGAFGYFMTSQSNGITTNPGAWLGSLCVDGGQIARQFGGPRFADSEGRARVLTNRALKPSLSGAPIFILPGDTWYYQYWYQDPGMTPSSNFSDALQIDWTLF